MVLEITTTPLVIMAILGVAGVSLPLAGMRRPDLHHIYAAVAMAALLVSHGVRGLPVRHGNGTAGRRV